MRVATGSDDCDPTIDARPVTASTRRCCCQSRQSCRFYRVEIFFVNCKWFTTPAIFRLNPRWKTDGNRYDVDSTSRYTCLVLLSRLMRSSNSPGSMYMPRPGARHLSALPKHTLQVYNTVLCCVIFSHGLYYIPLCCLLR